jgi:hypothetical protein
MRQEAFTKPAIAIVDDARHARLVNTSFTASSVNTLWLTEARWNYFPPCVW